MLKGNSTVSVMLGQLNVILSVFTKYSIHAHFTIDLLEENPLIVQVRRSKRLQNWNVSNVCWLNSWN